MSKSRNHMHRRFNDELEYLLDENEKASQKFQERRKQKKIKSAIKAMDVEVDNVREH